MKKGSKKIKGRGWCGNAASLAFQKEMAALFRQPFYYLSGA
jgi:hypothetical protein